LKKILIIDELVFSRICSAILELEGHKTKIFKSAECMLPSNHDQFSLVITSYPFGYSFFEKIKKINLPTIIMTDQINRDLMNLLKPLRNAYCMIKPIDYDKFRSLVREIMNCGMPNTSEFYIL
jgi:DNA-binding NtrC family response regulator